MIPSVLIEKVFLFPLKVQLFLFKDVWGGFDPPFGKGSIRQRPTWSKVKRGDLQPLFSGLEPSVGACGNRLREKSQLRETGSVCPTRFLVEVRFSRATGGTGMPWGERARERGNAEMKKDYLPQH